MSSRTASPQSLVELAAWSPGRDEAWWWLLLPVGLALALFVVHAVSPAFYIDYVLPEGYGFLEIGHFFIPLAASILSLALFRFRLVRESRLLTAAAIVFALSCLYIAGEEMSWGQHFLQWSTPEYWAAINRQEETNLHNVSPWFNQRPRLVIEIGVLVGSVLLPLWQLVKGPVTKSPLIALFIPPIAMLPVGLVYLVFKLVDHTTKREFVTGLLSRPNEAVETFIYLFLLYYVVIFYRRVRLLEASGVERVPA